MHPGQKGPGKPLQSALWLCNGKATAKTPEFQVPAPVSSLATDFAADQAAVAPSKRLMHQFSRRGSSQVAPKPPGLSIPAEINRNEVVVRLGDRRSADKGAI